MENEEVIKIEHLNKSFGEVKAVNDLSFSVKKGELFAFLGVNGAGKSTTISIICGQLVEKFLYDCRDLRCFRRIKQRLHFSVNHVAHIVDNDTAGC